MTAASSPRRMSWPISGLMPISGATRRPASAPIAVLIAQDQR